MYNQENVQVVEKKTNPTLIIAVIIILVIGVGVGGWFLGRWYADYEDKQNNPIVENKEESNKEEEISNVPIKNERYTFVQEKSHTFKLGNQDKKIIAYYYIDKESLTSADGESKVDMNIVRREVFVDGVKVKDIDIISVDEEYSVESINNDVIKNVETFKDSANDDFYYIISYSDVNHNINNGRLATMMGDATVEAQIYNHQNASVKKIIVSIPFQTFIGLKKPSNGVSDRYTKKLEDYENTLFAYPSNDVIDSKENYIYYINIKPDNEYKYEEFKLYFENGIMKEKRIGYYNEDEVEIAGAV